MIVAHVLPGPLWSFQHWFVNAGPNGGYGFWSGVAGATAIFSGILIFWVKHNCHQHRCLRLSWHPGTNGHPVCKVHHDDHPSRGWFRSDRSHPRHAANLAHGESPDPDSPPLAMGDYATGGGPLPGRTIKDPG